MFCRKCGKEISNQAKFCNYCGAQTDNVQPQPAPAAAAQPRTSSEDRMATPKKKGGAGKAILSILIVVIVYFSVKSITQNVIKGAQNSSNPSAGSNSGTIEIYGGSNSSDSSSTTGTANANLTEACIYGALYQDGYLSYGMTKLHMPGYFLQPGEGDQRDWLISSDETCHFAASRQLEIMNISFDATTEEAMLKSVQQAYGDASIVHFEKLYINDYPIIRCIAKCKADDVDQYIGETIVFPSEITKETIRLKMYKLAESGYEEITRVFETLNIYPQFAPKAEDTNVMGYNRITVK